MSGLDWRLGQNQDNPINALMQGMQQGNALSMQREDRQLQQQDRDFDRQRILQNDQRQATQDAAQAQRQAKADEWLGKVQGRQQQDWTKEDVIGVAKGIRNIPEAMMDQRAAMYTSRAVPMLRDLKVPEEDIERVLADGKLTDAEIDTFIEGFGGEGRPNMQLVQQQGYVGAFDPRQGTLTGLREPPPEQERPPTGYAWGQDGSLQYIPGGPADPRVVGTRAAAGRAPKSGGGGSGGGSPGRSNLGNGPEPNW